LITLMHGLEQVLLNLYLEVSPDQAGAATHGYPNLEKLLACLRSRDAEASHAAMRSHLLRQRALVVERLAARSSSSES
jgi:DNA-binding GntR family transcriptional regulator